MRKIWFFGKLCVILGQKLRNFSKFIMTLLIILLVTFSTLGIGGMVSYFVWDYYNQRKLANQRISDQTVIEIARENGGKIDIALLCENTGVSVKVAKTKLEYLAENKLLAKDWQDMLFGSAGVYRLPNSQNENIFTKFLKTKGSLAKRIETLFDNNSSQETKSLPTGSPNKDAQIISLAIENQGTVTASAVCVKLNITIDEAQKRLEDLRQKQIFMTEVGQNGGIVYRLLDA
jgi:uncharacterized membrane protein